MLSGLTDISAEAAESLSNFKGAELGLMSLTSLCDAAAESLSKYEGYLDLMGLTELSDAAAKFLAKIDPDKIVLSEAIEAQVARYR